MKMFNLTLIIFVLFFTASHTTFGSTYPDIKFCDQYLDLSDSLNCNRTKEDNYFIKFGYRYCRKFIQKNDKFSNDGQEKLDSIRKCLIDNLRYDRSLTCENSKKIGYQSHIPCYIENGYCEMNLQDKFWIASITIAELPESNYRATGFELLQYCSQN